MLSRVKEGITHRSRSSQSIRRAEDGAENEGSLLRKLSGKRKQSSDERGPMQSFEISRESIDSQPDAEGCTSTSQRSFTDSSIVTDELMGTGLTMTPPSAIRSSSTHASNQLVSASPSPRTPNGEPTPRAIAPRDSVLDHNGETPELHISIPYIDLSVTIDRDTIDVGISREIWVAVEATVRSKLVGFSANRYTKAAGQKRLDAVVLVCQKTLASYPSMLRQCIVELCSRLSSLGDRLAVVLVSTYQLNASTINCEGAEVHGLGPPRTAALLDRLGLTPTTVRHSLDNDAALLPFRTALEAISEQGIRRDAVQTFVLASAPDDLTRAVDESFQWPTHSIKIGDDVPQSVGQPHCVSHGWRLQITGDGELCSSAFDNMFEDIRNGVSAGGVPSLRICYKPMEGCRIIDIIGDKAVKDLKLGQKCYLFLKVHVPKVCIKPSPKNELDHNSLFVELESIVGTLHSNVLHIEARYRHTALPAETVVTVRQICNIRRPKTESRWSLVASAIDRLSSNEVHLKLARFLSMHYDASKAVNFIDRWDLATSSAVKHIRGRLVAKLGAEWLAHDATRSPSPAVIITDIDTNTSHRASSILSTLPQRATRTASAATLIVTQPRARLPHSTSSSTIIPTRAISAPKATTAISLSPVATTQSSRESTSSDANDSAHQLWHHLRRNSLSARQMLEMTPDKLQQLEEGDESLRELRHQALANKRSVGAETLKAWKWEDKTNGCGGEAPWL